MKATRPTVVLVHGAANSAVVWKFWQEHLEAAGYPTLAPDLRGHGAQSFAGLDRTSMADSVEDVRRVTGGGELEHAGQRLARFLDGQFLELAGASHWGLVLNRGALRDGMPSILGWLDALSGDLAIR